MNKTIYLTYKKQVPDIVFSRWKETNPTFNMDFSLDNDCIQFLQTHFNEYITELFKRIPIGMYKADLWRLCKLYINGGIYSDVDLVPYLDLDILDKDVTFYSCLSKDKGSVFQAFMATFSKPNNPLILHFLISFLINAPYKYENGPTYDMYNCIKHNLNTENIMPETKYNINEIKIPISIGISETSTKTINLYYFPDNIEYAIKFKPNMYKKIKFNFEIKNNNLIVTRIDKKMGWSFEQSLEIVMKSKETIFLFPEQLGSNNHWSTSFITLKNKKIFDSRDMNYYNNGRSW